MVDHPVTTTKNGVEICVNLISSPAAPKISKQPHLLALAKEVLARTRLKGETVLIEEDLGRTVGTTEIVETTPGDTILYAKRPKSDSFTRFVKNRKMAETSTFSIELRQNSKNVYQVWDLRIGGYAPATPSEQNESKKSKTFWSNHAVVWENGVAQAHTITKECPWES